MDKAQGNTQIDTDVEKLEQYFLEITKKDICLAFSGGVDSSLLLKAAVDAAGQNGSQVYAVTLTAACIRPVILRLPGRWQGNWEGFIR